MTDINTALAEIEIKQSSIATISKSTTEQIKKLIERIRNGETTGDQIKDYKLSCGEWIGGETEKTLRTVQDKISEHQGEFILAIERTERFEGCVGFGYEPRNSDYHLRQYLTLGVLSGTKLIIEIDAKKTSCSLPTSRYMHVYNTPAVDLKVESGNLNPFWTMNFWYCLNRKMDLKNPFNRMRGDILEAELIIGDQAVSNWFGKSDETLFHRAARKIGRESGIKTPVQSEAV